MNITVALETQFGKSRVQVPKDLLYIVLSMIAIEDRSKFDVILKQADLDEFERVDSQEQHDMSRVVFDVVLAPALWTKWEYTRELCLSIHSCQGSSPSIPNIHAAIKLAKQLS